MPLQDSVKSLMNSRVISVLSDTPILTAIDIILTNRFNGIPVTEKSGEIVGILTKYDLIVKRGYIRDDSIVGDVMNKDPLILQDTQTVNDAIVAFSEHHRVDPIPVVNLERKVVGIISRADMVKLFQEYGLSSTSARDTKRTDARPSVNSFRLIMGLLAVAAVIVAAVYYIFL